MYADPGCMCFRCQQKGLAPAPRPERSKACYLAVDIGGTFTDSALENETGELFTAKVLTTPEDPAEGFIAAAIKVLQLADRNPADVRLVLHGTTLATNAILERKGARAALLTTEGFRDVLGIGDGGRHNQSDFAIVKTEPLIPNELRFTVTQRHRCDGTEDQDLDESGVRVAAQEIRKAKAESVAICFMHSYANHSHEERAASILREELPGIPICLSSEVCPEVRENERFSTAATNAYVQPLMTKYLKKLDTKLGDLGFRCPLLLMASDGGLCDLATASALPVRLIESGPAGGVMLAKEASQEAGTPHVLSFDMGGTTAKICFLEKYKAVMARMFEVDRAARFQKGSGLPCRIPCIDLVEISGGGGSIARVNAVGSVVVGPDSAGSFPGPACYDRGGSDVTVTDADVVLGRIEPERFAVGEVQLQPAKSREALQQGIVKPQGLKSEEEAAAAVSEMVEESMANAARVHAAELGRNLSAHTLFAFGGAAPLHAARLAEKLGLSSILVPQNAGVGSAVGFLSAPLAFDAVHSHRMRLSAFDPEVANAAFRGLFHKTVEVVAAGLARFGPGCPAREERSAFGRYCGQGNEVKISLPNRDLNHDDANLIKERFEESYVHLFGRKVPDTEIEILSFSLHLVADKDPAVYKRSLVLGGELTSGDAGAKYIADLAADEPLRKRQRLEGPTRKIFDGEARQMIEAPVYSRDELIAGEVLTGPAIVVEKHTSTLVTKSFNCEVLRNGFLKLEKKTSLTAEELEQNGKAQEDKQVNILRGSDDANFQMMWVRLTATAEEMAQVLLRTAFSPTIREAGQLSCSLFDREGRLLAQSMTGTPASALAMEGTIRHIIERFSSDGFEEGDAFCTNDPWLGAGQLHELALVTPIIVKGRGRDPKGELIGFAASTGHLGDVGGNGRTTDGEDVQMEGLTLPIVRILQRDVMNDALLDVLRSNTRRPLEVVGDVHALVACNDVAVRRMAAMLSDFGYQDLQNCASYICNASHNAVMKKIQALPKGTWTHSVDFVTKKGDMNSKSSQLKITAQLEINSAGISMDFSGTTAACDSGCNAPPNYARAYTLWALACLLAKDVPLNAGSLRSLALNIPEESILHAKRPQPVAACHLVGHLLPDVVFGCLSGAMPNEVPAESSPVCQIDVRGWARSRSEGRFTASAIETGGMGARANLDGLSATAYPSGARGTPVEIIEAISPVLFRRKELRCDSGGAGKYSGGLGLHLEIQAAHDDVDLVVVPSLDRVWTPAAGRNGGQPGALANLEFSDGTAVSPEGVVRVPHGVSLMVNTGGGGGFGPPMERNKELVQADVRNGRMSENLAMRVYGMKKSDFE